jgi:hypothetical protein
MFVPLCALHLLESAVGIRVYEKTLCLKIYTTDLHNENARTGVRHKHELPPQGSHHPMR